MKIEKIQTNISYDSALLEIIKENAKPVTPIRPEGFGITAQEFADAQNCSYEQANNRLQELCKAGIFERTKMVLPDRVGSAPFVYYKKGALDEG